MFLLISSFTESISLLQMEYHLESLSKINNFHKMKGDVCEKRRVIFIGKVPAVSLVFFEGSLELLVL